MHRLAAFASLAAALTVTGLAGAGPAARAAAPSPQTVTVAPAWPGHGPADPTRRARAQTFAARVAQRLGNGITPAQVLAAFDAARGEDPRVPGRWMVAVAGRLGVQPAALRRAIAHAHASMHPAWRMRRRLFETAAVYLGMAPDAMLGQLRQGRSLADLANGAHRSVPGLESALLAALKPEVHRLVMTPFPVRGPASPHAAAV